MLVLRSLTIGLLFGPLATLGTTPAPGNLDALRTLVEANGAEYRHARDGLLARTRGLWNVSERANESWALGITAFVLNARQQHPQWFDKWDAETPALRASGTMYGLNVMLTRPDEGTALSAARVAFLLEKFLKPVTDRDAALGLADLGTRIANWAGPCHWCNSTMWRSVWERCPDQQLREVGLFFLCSSSDPSVLDVVSDVLQAGNDGNNRRLNLRCLAGLRYNELPEAADIILREWDRLRQDPALRRKALGALALSSNPAARQAVYEYARDRGNADRDRLSAVIACSVRPHPGDEAFVRQFLAEVQSPRLKRDVVSKLGGSFPPEWVRPIVRDILSTAENADLVSSAGVSMASTYIRTKDVSLAEVEQDIALFRKLIGRSDLPEDVRLRIQNFYLEPLEKRRDDQTAKDATPP